MTNNCIKCTKILIILSRITTEYNGQMDKHIYNSLLSQRVSDMRLKIYLIIPKPLEVRQGINTDRFHHADSFNNDVIQQKLTVFEIYTKFSVCPHMFFFSNDSHVFQRIKNPNINFVQNALRNSHTKFHLNPFSSLDWKIF